MQAAHGRLTFCATKARERASIRRSLSDESLDYLSSPKVSRMVNGSFLQAGHFLFTLPCGHGLQAAQLYFSLP